MPLIQQCAYNKRVCERERERDSGGASGKISLALHFTLNI